MKIGILNERLKAEVVEVDKPKLGVNDVLVKTVRSSICGSDVNMQAIDPGSKFGHETAGYLTELGKNVKGFKEGDRVWLNPMLATDQMHTCMLGGFSEYIMVPGDKLNGITPLPDAISWDEAALIEPFGVGTGGKNRAAVKPGENVVVYGAGSIGLFCINSLIAQGIKPVVFDIAFSDYKTKVLKELGAVICPPDADKFEFLKDHFGDAAPKPVGLSTDVDVFIDCAGVPDIFEDFFKLCKMGSRLSIVGIGPNQEISPAMVMFAKATIVGSQGYEQSDIDEVIDNLARNRTQVASIITHHYPLDQLNEALNMAANRTEAIKVVVDME